MVHQNFYHKMKRFVYIITDRNRKNLHVGLCSDLVKTLQFYSDMPTLFFDSAQQLNRLVYFEEINTEEQAMERFKVVSTYTRPQKEKMIRPVNPDWVDLTIGLKYESGLRVRPQLRPSVNANRRAVTF
ncbi:putative endonuclease [Mucilaginibacter lappiensis]|nr:putative endonuclease [Mucilaginibacter lappiensis]